LGFPEAEQVEWLSLYNKVDCIPGLGIKQENSRIG
jgi:hypothetical protein